MAVEIVIADYGNPQHASDLVQLLNHYAQDPMGGGEPLTGHTQANLVSQLAQVPGAFSVICYVDGYPAGLANCFQGFSTFKCLPLINVHDMVVDQAFRGHGLSQKMLDKITEQAVKRGCCKITLEVLSGNEVARQAYTKAGFSGYELDPAAGHAVFWQKSLHAA